MMAGFQKLAAAFFTILPLLLFSIHGQEMPEVRINVSEPAGLERINEYVEVSLQWPASEGDSGFPSLIVMDEKSGASFAAQVNLLEEIPREDMCLIRVVFPVTLRPYQSRTFAIQPWTVSAPLESNLHFSGEGTELVVENEFFRADLTRSNQSEAKSHASGQLRELLIKMGHNRLLFRTENRLHWGPNFKRQGIEYYRTIAGWENPKLNAIEKGPYLIRTVRQDEAPGHPEILLTAVYKFYAGKPYFIFSSEMDMVEDIWLELLRNDEMTMDSMFTHVAFRRPGGEIVDLPFSRRYQVLENQPLENDAPWLCFYHAEKQYACGSIRLRYDINNRFGGPSPTYLPHTKISDGAGGGKYWNRRLIHDHLTFVPEGSRYVEENAYIVFDIDPVEKFKEIDYRAKRLQNPLRIEMHYAIKH